MSNSEQVERALEALEVGAGEERRKNIDIIRQALHHPQHEGGMSEDALNYMGAMSEIAEIVRVARDNPDGLIEFIKINFPKEWGLSKEEHKALLSHKGI